MHSVPGTGLLLTIVVAGCATIRPPSQVALPEPESPTAESETATPGHFDVLAVGDTATPQFDFTKPVPTQTIVVGHRQPTRHVVAPGETLFGIARDHLGHGGRWRELLDSNPRLQPDTLAAGDVVVIP